MDQWEVIRLRCVRDAEPIKRVARDLGLAPNTVRKYVRTQTVPQKVTLHRVRRLDRFQVVIDEYLRETPKITATRIGALLRQRHDADLQIGERALREYVASRRERLVPKEAFVRAEYAPGDQAQFDFSPMRVMLGGIEQVVQVFAMRLSYSGSFFARASYRQDRPALFAGLLLMLLSYGLDYAFARLLAIRHAAWVLAAVLVLVGMVIVLRRNWIEQALADTITALFAARTGRG